MADLQYLTYEPFARGRTEGFPHVEYTTPNCDIQWHTCHLPPVVFVGKATPYLPSVRFSVYVFRLLLERTILSFKIENEPVSIDLCDQH